MGPSSVAVDTSLSSAGIGLGSLSTPHLLLAEGGDRVHAPTPRLQDHVGTDSYLFRQGAPGVTDFRGHPRHCRRDTLRGADLGDVALVITRYFGGTKLGTGGLVSAYSATAKAAFESLATEEKVTRYRFSLTLPYSLCETVRRLLDEHECLLEDESFEADVRLRYLIPEEREAAFLQAVKDASAGTAIPVRVHDS